MAQNPEPGPFKRALDECRPLFAGALVFSLIINLLGLAVPIYSMQVFDRVLSSSSRETLLMLSLIVVGAVIFSGLLTALRSTVFAQISRWLDDRLSGELVHKTIALSLRRPKIGAQPLRDLGAVRGFIASPTLGSILDAPWATLFFIALFMINTTIGLVVAGASLILLGLAVLAQRAPSRLYAASGDARVKSMQEFESVVRNAEVVQAMGMEETATRAWRKYNDANLEKSYEAGNLGTVISNSTKSFRMGLQILVTGLGAWLVIHGQMSMGAIIAVNMLTGKALAPFDAAVPIYQGWTNVKKAHGRLAVVFEYDDKAEERIELPRPKGVLTVASIGYQDPTSKKWLLKQVSMDVPAGNAVGIIGPSGSGKTTLSRLLVGVLSPSKGRVNLDGAGLNQWRSDQLTQAVGYLPQDIELFAGTIAQNIARMNEKADDASVIEAAQLAQVHEFIISLPEGYQTEIGERGAALSAGQRQRVGLARCFYGSPKILVLDEPNSNLDTQGEQALVQALLNAKSQKITTLMVSHRPALLHHVDTIMVLKDGEVSLEGPAQGVLAKLAGQNKDVTPLRREQGAT